MRPVPIDRGVPIACTAGEDELIGRAHQLERLRRHLTRLDRTPAGVLLHFPERPEVEAEVASFAAAEQACCAFWSFEVTTTAEEITLRWEGPPSVEALFAALVELFEGDQPFTAFAGLL